MATLTTDDGQLVGYTDHGGDGPPLVLLHSFLMNREMFQPQIVAFSHEYRCLTIDERGHGESVTDAPFDDWQVADDVIAVLDHLAISGAILAGTSLGAFVALRVALRRPDLVSALVLMGTSAEIEPAETVAAYRELARTWTELWPVDPVVDAVGGICLGDYATTDDGLRWKEQWKTVSPDMMSRNLEALMTREEVLWRLGELNVPALVLHGSADGSYPVAKAENLGAGLSGSGDPVIVDGGAHFLSLTEADAVNQQLRWFLAHQV